VRSCASSGSPTDVQPVFDAIVRSGARLCEADYGFLARYDGTSMSIVAHSGATDEEIKAMLRVYPDGSHARLARWPHDLEAGGSPYL